MLLLNKKTQFRRTLGSLPSYTFLFAVDKDDLHQCSHTTLTLLPSEQDLAACEFLPLSLFWWAELAGVESQESVTVTLLRPRVQWFWGLQTHGKPMGFSWMPESMMGQQVLCRYPCHPSRTSTDLHRPPPTQAGAPGPASLRCPHTMLYSILCP